MSAASGLCGVCSQWRELGQGAEFEVVVPGQSSPATGLCRFGRQLHPPVLALGLQNGPERRASLGWNERNFLSLFECVGDQFVPPEKLRHLENRRKQKPPPTDFAT